MAKGKIKKRRKNKKLRYILMAAVFIALSAGIVYLTTRQPDMSHSYEPFDIAAVPAFCGEPTFTVNGNTPYFTEEELRREYFAAFSPLDALGRCGTATACLHWKNMPTEPRGEIGMVRPSGWHTVRYDDLIEDKYLYNRCHLIAYMFCGENANTENLITGTRYLNKSGMLPLEKQVSDYLYETGNHVMYRVTPVFNGNELLCRGVLMEAYSVEDSGRGLHFNVFVYNVYPGIEIDYATGDSRRS